MRGEGSPVNDERQAFRIVWECLSEGESFQIKVESLQISAGARLSESYLFQGISRIFPPSAQYCNLSEARGLCATLSFWKSLELRRRTIIIRHQNGCGWEYNLDLWPCENSDAKPRRNEDIFVSKRLICIRQQSDLINSIRVILRRSNYTCKLEEKLCQIWIIPIRIHCRIISNYLR